MNDLMLGTGGYMTATNDGHIVGLDYGGDFFFFRQNTDRPELLYRFGKKGQGPDEFIHPFSLQYLNDSLIACYDMSSRQFSEITLNPHSTRLKVNTLSFTSDMNFRILKTAYGQYAGLGAYPEGMFKLYDSRGNAVGQFFEYPYRDADEKSIKNPVRAMACQGKIGASPSGTKFAYAAAYADIIHFYNLKENDIQLIKKIETRFCEYVPDDDENSFSAGIKPSNRLGYVDLYATEKYVYFLYSGKTIPEYREKAFESSLLRIYDWSGSLLTEAALDVSCKFLCVSPDDKTMWAIAEIPEPAIVRFDLSGKFKDSKIQ
jgi:WD40 repeat protein